jgi:hypothetical protein
MTDNLTEKQLHWLRHMLGINDRRKKHPEPYRNYAAVNPSDPEFVEMEKLGVVRLHRPSSGDVFVYDCWVVTDSGKKAAFKSFYARRFSKSKRKYHAFLSLRDCFDDLTFKEFLMSPEFADVRANA